MERSVKEWRDRLKRLGLIRGVAGGLQIDLNAVIGVKDSEQIHGTLCDHNCTTEMGSYTCPSALSLNRGMRRSSMVPSDLILKGIDVAVNGLRQVIDQFLEERFDDYCDSFAVPPEVAQALSDNLRESPIEVNLSGGNPEIHPDLITILAALRRREDVVTNLTTTGRRIMHESGFREELLAEAPDLLALSADDFSDIEQIRLLGNRSSDELVELWRQVPREHGQGQKALEALAAATMLSGAQRPHTSFNLVVHPRNLAHAEDIMHLLGKTFPGCSIFPYPAQTAFLHEHPTGVGAVHLEAFIDRMIDVHSDDALPMVHRLHYWLALKAVCLRFGHSPETVAEMTCGRAFWRCYKESLMPRYLQLGNPGASTRARFGGGYLGCVWNTETINDHTRQVWDLEPKDIVHHATKMIQARAAASPRPCPGCAFPRLLFDVANTELGLNEELLPSYLDLRREHVGY
jgi:hypothetical protein